MSPLCVPPWGGPCTLGPPSRTLLFVWPYWIPRAVPQEGCRFKFCFNFEWKHIGKILIKKILCPNIIFKIKLWTNLHKSLNLFLIFTNIYKHNFDITKNICNKVFFSFMKNKIMLNRLIVFFFFSESWLFLIVVYFPLLYAESISAWSNQGSVMCL